MIFTAQVSFTFGQQLAEMIEIVTKLWQCGYSSMWFDKTIFTNGRKIASLSTSRAESMSSTIYIARVFAEAIEVSEELAQTFITERGEFGNLENFEDAEKYKMRNINKNVSSIFVARDYLL